MIRTRAFALDPAGVPLSAIGLVMLLLIEHVRAEPLAPQNAPPTEMGAFGLLPPLNSFEQTLLLETLKGVVFALIIALVAFCVNRVMERYKLREALFGEYLKKRTEKVTETWGKLNQLDSAWSNLILDKEAVTLASLDPTKGIDDEKLAQELREDHERLKSRLRPKEPKELARLEREVADLKAEVVRSIDGERLWLGTWATEELKRFYLLLRNHMETVEERHKERVAYLKETSSLPLSEKVKKGLKHWKAQIPLDIEGRSRRAEIDALKIDLLKTIRRIARDRG
jgi:hypothetical protein